MPGTILASDMHLDPERPESMALFDRFLDEIAAGADALYLLGDLFEVWLGDDAIHPAYEPVLERLAALSRAGTAVCIQHGNRDFLMGSGLAERLGATLLPEEAVAELGGTPTLLLHGDTLCTDDTAYQAFRAQVRDPAWQAGFLALSPEERMEQARQARAASREAQAAVDNEITDVNAGAVAEAFRRHDVRQMIHGHTHRPADHALSVDGRPARRLVLPQWTDRGGYIRCDEDTCKLLAYPWESRLPTSDGEYC
ncbi:MAG: UDP-2,3-diacylglucosamine diphosphatase [Thiohalospira sp.]